MRRRVAMLVAGVGAIAGGLPGAAAGDRLRPNPNVAGMQAALKAKGFYRGPIDGIKGPLTRAAVRALQRRHGLRSYGLADARTRSALGALGRPRYATRVLRRGMVGLDVAALQFELRYHGFPNAGRGVFGWPTLLALKRFQRFARLPPDGAAGRRTYQALSKPPPRAPFLRAPLPVIERATAVGRAVELSCGYATPVAAAIGGTVAFSGNRRRGYGYTVTTRNRKGLEVLYAHLARIDVRKGQTLLPGAMIGLAGWTGKKRPSTSLRVEMRLRGAELDVFPALQRRH
jgi:peptidoglycan hydrolase-like protein with peptidoglycan-binding domain